MASSHSRPGSSRLTPLQRELLDGFFAREQRLFLTGGGALAGFYFGHRDTEDELRIAPDAALPAGVDPVALDRFRNQLVPRLRALAFDRARRDPP